jgi:hypothetical protein
VLADYRTPLMIFCLQSFPLWNYTKNYHALNLLSYPLKLLATILLARGYCQSLQRQLELLCHQSKKIYCCRDEESDNDESDNDESDASSSEEETVEYFNGPGRSQSVTNLGARQPALDEDTRQRSISSDNIIDTSSPSLKRSKGLFSVVDGVKGESGVVGDDLDASGITDEEDNSFVNEIMDTLRMDADWNSMFGQWKLTTRSRSFHAPRSNPNNNRSKRSASTVDIPKKIETI